MKAFPECHLDESICCSKTCMFLLTLMVSFQLTVSSMGTNAPPGFLSWMWVVPHGFCGGFDVFIYSCLLIPPSVFCPLVSGLPY